MENSIATINQGRPVYFSYARNSSRKPEWEHISDCVDTLLNTLTDNGLEYRVDVKDIGMGDKISKFEEEIGWNSEVVVIIFSDKYFRSMHCMYEFVQIKRALEQYPEKRLMCIKSGDFNLSDVNYIRDLERYWGSLELDYKDIEYHRLRNHSGTEIAAHENGFYLDEIRNLYSFFSAINYSNANNINYDGFVGDIVKYYKTTPKPKLTPKPTKSAPQQHAYTAQQQTYTAQSPSNNAYPPPYTAQSLPTTKKSPIVTISIAAVVLGFLIYFLAGKNSTTTEQSPTTNEQTATTDNTTNTDNNDHPYVDLGLPSGTLWASCNIGANAPEEYGDYFAWGETETKSNYNWSTYKYAKGAKEELTKYCNDSDYGNKGYTDSRTTLERSDDAASVNWGSDWCMPTQEQFQELSDKCEWTWVSKNGKEGYKIEGTNGNTIFLPAAGYRDGTALGDAGSDGSYWSSSLRTDSSDRGRGLYFDSGNVDPDDWVSRLCGQSVRAVRCR
ncbi:MAG: toll/interleukin-1 receptor domain-containing protein [Bacteroidales bacterium]|nr:toll/interleukin-1 receptor domain-containing protein [Bacteroidales bacterium]